MHVSRANIGFWTLAFRTSMAAVYAEHHWVSEAKVVDESPSHYVLGSKIGVLFWQLLFQNHT